jgi:hypothetical protein
MENIEEIWKDIIGFEGYYQVSNFGNVKSVDREINYITGKKYFYKSKPIKYLTDKDGYYRVDLNKGNKSKRFFIHRLVGIHFIENSNNLPQINHKDGIKINNYDYNLEWCSNLQNIEHSWKTGLRGSNIKRGEQTKSAKLKEVDVINIRNLYRNKELNQRELKEKYNVALGTISEIINYKKWKHIK